MTSPSPQAEPSIPEAAWAQWCEALGASGVSLDAGQRQQLMRHAALIRQWNAFSSLVSVGDLECLWENHIQDALSLVPLMLEAVRTGGMLLDIGSGGGFPAIPLKVALPGLSMTLVERSTKKVGFLRKVIGALGLEGITLIQGEFPQRVAGLTPSVVTARAVERPERILSDLARYLPQDALFLSQFPVSEVFLSSLFHVEPEEGQRLALGSMRGRLRLCRAKAAC